MVKMLVARLKDGRILGVFVLQHTHLVTQQKLLLLFSYSIS